MNLIRTLWVLCMSTIWSSFCLWIGMSRHASGRDHTLSSPPCWWPGGRCQSPSPAPVLSGDSFVQTSGYLWSLWTGWALWRTAVNQKTAHSKCLWTKQEIILFWLHSTSLKRWGFSAARGSWEYTTQNWGIQWCIQRLFPGEVSEFPCISLGLCWALCVRVCLSVCVCEKRSKHAETGQKGRKTERQTWTQLAVGQWIQKRECDFEDCWLKENWCCKQESSYWFAWDFQCSGKKTTTMLYAVFK